jgi:hypothetical protein
MQKPPIAAIVLAAAAIAAAAKAAIEIAAIALAATAVAAIALAASLLHSPPSYSPLLLHSPPSISLGTKPSLSAERAEAARRQTSAIKEAMDAPGEADVCSSFVAAEHIPLGDEVEQCDMASHRLRHTHHMASRRICHTSPTDGALAAALTVALATALAAALAATFAT